MGKMVEKPRYHVISFRVSDEEFAAIEEARAAGLDCDKLRSIVLLGARLITSDPPLPLSFAAFSSACHEVPA